MLQSQPQPPNWAVSESATGLKLGLSMLELESRLVEKGLSHEVATAAVNAALSTKLAGAIGKVDDHEWTLKVHRGLLIAVVLISLGLAFLYNGVASVGLTTLWLITPAWAVWAAEFFEDHAPPILIRWVAWVAVLAIMLYRVVLLIAWG